MPAVDIAAALTAFAAVSLWLALWGWAWDKLRRARSNWGKRYRWRLWYGGVFGGTGH